MKKKQKAKKPRNYLATDATRININALKKRLTVLELAVEALAALVRARRR